MMRKPGFWKKLCVILVVVLVVAAGVFGITYFLQHAPFSLEKEYYGTAELTEIDASEFQRLVDDHKSFALLIYNEACTSSASADFQRVILDYQNERPMKFYELKASEVEQTSLADTIKFFPSFAIFRKGELVDFLDAASDEDLAAYSTMDGFNHWLASYIRLPRATESDAADEDATPEGVSSQLSDIKPAEGKVNIYFFYGQGCPHCAEEFKFFKKLARTHGDLYNLYFFETWNNDNNAELAQKFAAAMGDKVTGVPYAVIGDQGFIGFRESEHGDLFRSAIRAGAKHNFDIYFDKVKPQLDAD